MRYLLTSGISFLSPVTLYEIPLVVWTRHGTSVLNLCTSTPERYPLHVAYGLRRRPFVTRPAVPYTILSHLTFDFPMPDRTSTAGDLTGSHSTVTVRPLLSYFSFDPLGRPLIILSTSSLLYFLILFLS